MLPDADPTGACYKALGFSPGFEAPLNPYVRLLVMLAGIKSPGTIQEVGGSVGLLRTCSGSAMWPVILSEEIMGGGGGLPAHQIPCQS